MSDTNTGPFTDAERVQIRKYCWYPAYGPGADGFQNWRFFQEYGTLEFRLTNMTADEMTEVRSKLTDLTALEAAIPAAAANLDTDKAAVWTHNKTEVQERIRLFAHWRKELCCFLGLPPGPGLMGASGRQCVV